jgi:hypothetical protein
MKQHSVFPHMGIQILFKAFLLVILLGGFISGTSPLAIEAAFADDAAFAADAPPAKPNAQGLSEPKKKECVDDPVACVEVDVNQVPYPGCTSGKRCSYDTAGKTCTPIGVMPVRKCQTVNYEGVCSCQCIQ